MAAGLGVLARLTQQASQNRVAEQNFRSGLAKQARSEITENRRLRISEQSDISARNDRDLDRDQRERRAQEDLDLKEAQLANQTRNTDSLIASRLPTGGGGASNALFPGGILEGATPEAPDGLVISDKVTSGGNTPTRGGFDSKTFVSDSLKSNIELRNEKNRLNRELNQASAANKASDEVIKGIRITNANRNQQITPTGFDKPITLEAYRNHLIGARKAIIKRESDLKSDLFDVNSIQIFDPNKATTGTTNKSKDEEIARFKKLRDLATMIEASGAGEEATVDHEGELIKTGVAIDFANKRLDELEGRTVKSTKTPPPASSLKLINTRPANEAFNRLK